ncbi:hypothetical protein [Streptomyces albicerus]|uniref:hypothetical protein n=1 Tax=Streptomyces albicerus TaxID=2569859 RepID=UPI001CEC5A4E|nr:hypothetical protein [Streptomyces albicerus]
MVRPLTEAGADEYIHYGTHFTSMFRRCCPERVTTARIEAEGRLKILERPRGDALRAA